MNNFNENLQKLQDYPHIHEFITKFQGDDELIRKYCSKLLRDTREDTRKGFPEEATEALMYFASSGNFYGCTEEDLR